jgi:hypothetical protein
MLDNTWKIRQDLCKAYKIYYEKDDSFLRSYSYNAKEGNQLHDIRLALAYVLCRYFDFNYEFYYNLPFSYKWHIAYDYMFRYGECFRAYYKFLTEDNTNHTQELDLSKPLKGEITDKQYGIIHDSKFDYGYITTLNKGNIYFDIENNKQYIFDGKKILEIG